MKIHNRVVVDIFSGEVLEDDWFEYRGEISKCKGGGSSSSSKPLDLDSYMKNTLYPELQNYYGETLNTYKPSQNLATFLEQNKALQDVGQQNLTGAQGDIAAQESMMTGLNSPEGFKAALQPYLTQAYQGIGNSGMPTSSYADKTLGEATTQGYMQNLNNIMSGYQNIANQRTGVTNIGNALDTMQSQQYGAVNEPLDFIKAIQSGRYGQSISKSSTGGGGLFK